MFQQPTPLDRVRENARANLRQLLAYIFGCSFLIAAFNGVLDSSTGEKLLLGSIVSLFFGIPVGLVVFILYKILGFAFPRLDFTHRYRSR